MKVTKGFNGHIIVDLDNDEAIKFRRWIDSQNLNDSKIFELADDVSDGIFRLTYRPVLADEIHEFER